MKVIKLNVKENASLETVSEKVTDENGYLIYFYRKMSHSSPALFKDKSKDGRGALSLSHLQPIHVEPTLEQLDLIQYIASTVELAKADSRNAYLICRDDIPAVLTESGFKELHKTCPKIDRSTFHDDLNDCLKPCKVSVTTPNTINEEKSCFSSCKIC